MPFITPFITLQLQKIYKPVCGQKISLVRIQMASTGLKFRFFFVTTLLSRKSMLVLMLKGKTYDS